MSDKKWVLVVMLAVLVVSAVIYISPTQKRISEIPMAEISRTNEAAPRLSTISANLEIPWALVFLPASPPASPRLDSARLARGEQGGPDRRILFTERSGRVRSIDNKGNLDPNPVAVIDDVRHQGEGGLLGIAIHPNFTSNHFVYLYYTYSNVNSNTLNRVVRFEFENNKLQNPKTIVEGIPGASNHNGGRIKFGPDGFLYIATGDAQTPSLAQNTDSLAGKILRVTDDGLPAPDNPFGNMVFSFGHRNPQGITWDNNNALWETEHGPSALDELNTIEKGKNYGWPTITGDQTQNDMETPILNSGSDTWAPSGTAYLNGSIFFAGLRGQALFEYNIGNKTLTPHLKGEIGRIREVVVGPDNLLYITTNNRDGRGIPDSTDDKIIRINPSKL